MTKRIYQLGCQLVMLTVLLPSGCVSWTRPLVQLDPRATETLELPSDQFRPAVRGVRSRPTPTARQTAAPDSTKTAPTRSANPTTSGGDTAGPSGNTAADRSDTVVRGQQPEVYRSPVREDRYDRQPLPVSGTPTGGSISPSPTSQNSAVAPAQYAAPYNAGYPDAPNYTSDYEPPPPYTPRPAAGPPISYGDATTPAPEFQPGPSDMLGPQPYTGRYADLIVNVREQQTGRFMFGVGINSDAGLTGQIVLDEYNFDWRRFPHSAQEIINGTAWRGGGQRLRIEAIPGSELQRYLVNFTEPYLFDTNISLNLSGFLYDRDYFDWDEQRLGGRIGLGYRLTPDLSLSAGMRLENVNISDPRVLNVPELNEVLGDSALYSGRVSLTHDTRDSPFAATEGHLLELSFEQVFGTFSYPRGIVDYRRYFLITERPDGSGRHTLGASLQAGFSGSDTPLYENFFAGGYSTLRGFRFRNASPKSGDVFVGGEFSFLGSAEYMFPITADDMLKGVVFCDYGTIEEEVQFEADDFRVAVGAGLRIAIPAMGPAPIAVDFAVPLAREETDRIQNFSFFVGFGR